jgi:hypothetical protein
MAATRLRTRVGGPTRSGSHPSLRVEVDRRLGQYPVTQVRDPWCGRRAWVLLATYSLLKIARGQKIEVAGSLFALRKGHNATLIGWLAKDLVHHLSALGERWPDLVAIDRLGRGRAVVSRQQGNAFHGDAVGGQDRHEGVPHLPGHPVLA